MIKMYQELERPKRGKSCRTRAQLNAISEAECVSCFLGQNPALTRAIVFLRFQEHSYREIAELLHLVDLARGTSMESRTVIATNAVGLIVTSHVDEEANREISLACKKDAAKQARSHLSEDHRVAAKKAAGKNDWNTKENALLLEVMHDASFLHTQGSMKDSPDLGRIAEHLNDVHGMNLTANAVSKHIHWLRKKFDMQLANKTDVAE